MNRYSNVLLILVLMFSVGCASKGKMQTQKRAMVAIENQQLDPALRNEMKRGLSLLKQKQYGQAEAVFKRLTESNPKLTSPLLNLALVYYRQERLLEAESTLREGLRRNSYRPEIYNLLGVVLRLQGRFREAESAYGYALQIDDNYANAHMNIAVLYDLYLQDQESAKRHYRKYVALEPNAEKQVNAWMLDMQQRAQVSN